MQRGSSRSAKRTREGLRAQGTLASVVTLTLHSVIQGRRVSGEPEISRLWSEIPGSPFGRPRNDEE